ncbi:acetoacetate--CoA ligase [Halobacteriovorax sp. GB3]|uniref:acetoacetate--CoA ligase n=1 Tax=Halobacteriovorax sp. GB3 TaxID=2719615 RepID=UPI00235E3472|nr:acetoacetate--CoA ligase [Halobacteriovorax sp. GB3]MDD0853324.1 acetoacetate--CoA ligase [Halobacteriovorax sp. GB3]
MEEKLLWSPSQSRIEKTQMYQFAKRMKEKGFVDTLDYKDLHTWSVEHKESFWTELIEYFDIDMNFEKGSVLGEDNFESYSWFPGASLNFAKNLLKKGRDEKIALNAVYESGKSVKTSYKELRSKVSRFQQALDPFFNKGDVLACYMPNISETVISMLAATSLGGTFTSTSSDFGVEGVVDRFGQSRPKVLVAACGYEYNGKYFDCLDKIKRIQSELPFIEKIILVNFTGGEVDISGIENAIMFEDFLAETEKELKFVDVSFDSPLYIMYSSGTTGKPKCIVHSTGGVLLQHVKELGLHSDLNENKNIMFFTTCGWMMWNWLVSSLYFGATTTLYEGSPAIPSLSGFLDIINREEIHIFGTSPKFLRALEDSGEEISTFDSLESILSTGAPLLSDQYDFIYSKIKSDILVASISGGTDIIGCFMLGCPILPVYRGELQCLGLGMDVACFDSNGKALIEKEGELVCRQTFPSRPLYFLGDDKGERIRDAYFNAFKDTWHHGDFITLTNRGTVIVHGRSDATLNPGGVRIGTAEIYRQTETLSYLEDSICVGKQIDGDVDVYLFVKMIDGESLTDERIGEIKTLIRKNTTPRHMPKVVLPVKGIPYTRSGKKMELAVSRLINGKELTNIEAVSNPECLSEYK